MYLAELELHGFKSFANKTKVKFDDGITAIVGPNGCGKSNIVDSLRWVLGEQRPSLLRSSAMSNVIFNGTATKKALSLAEVSVTIHNNKGILPTEFTDVTLTRRLYRSGESEYLLNNTPCRLKDITELFMDTGMGTNAYSVIELKMVEEILNDKQNERRKLFEEAAGVTKYKERRKQTFKKLEETHASMQRVDDLLLEIRKKVRSLQLQAGRAIKAKEYETELHQLDKALNRVEFDRFQSELVPLMDRIITAEHDKQELGRNIETSEQQLELNRTNLRSKELVLLDAQQKLNKLLNELRDTDTLLKITREKIINEENTIRQYELDIVQSERDIKDLRLGIKDNEILLHRSLDEATLIEEELKKAHETFELILQDTAAKKEDLERVAKDAQRLNTELSQLEGTRIRNESKLESLVEDLERLQRSIESVNEELVTLREEEDTIRFQYDQAKDAHELAEQKLEEARALQHQLRERQNELRDSVRAEQSKLDALESEITLLQNIFNSHDAFPAGVQFLIEERKNLSWKVVSDVLSTSEDLAVALESVLGEALYFVLVDTLEQARDASDALRTADKGKATFVPLSILSDTHTILPESLYHKVQSAPEFDKLKALLLGKVLLCATLEEGVERIKTHAGSVAVTPQGDLVTSEGFVRAGSTGKNVGIRVGLKDKIEKLERAALQSEEQLEKFNRELTQVQHTLTTIRVEDLHALAKVAAQDLRRFEAQHSSFEAKKSVLERNLATYRERKQGLIEAKTISKEELDEALPKIDALREQARILTEEQVRKRSEVERSEENKLRSQTLYNEIKLEHQAAANKAEQYKREIERSNLDIDGIKQRLNERAENAKKAKDRILGYRTTIEENEFHLDDLNDLRGKAEVELREADEACAKERGRINQLEDELKAIRRKRDITLELLHQLELSKNKLDMHLASISDHVWETYGTLMEKLEGELPEGMSSEQAKEIIQGLRQKLKNLGEVNPLAIEEFQQEEERLKFFEQQIEDLQNAEAQLKQTIDEINANAEERFMNTFNQIRSNFITVFQTLFEENDECDLTIEENPEDPLESRIEIFARPRGKRPSTINQLSGGEKTLTAIALLFAIYLVKPSPFCILDEVDAPLDDANIERFAKILKRFSKDTQFIIITHNKKTMEKAEVMYGVTMPEMGVSQLVAVQMDSVL